MRRVRVDGPGSFNGCPVPSRTVMFVVLDDAGWSGIFASTVLAVTGRDEGLFQLAERNLQQLRQAAPAG